MTAPASTPATRVHEYRASKALQLACVILSHGGSDREAAALDDAGWAKVAELGSTNPPSDATKAATIAMLIVLDDDLVLQERAKAVTAA